MANDISRKKQLFAEMMANSIDDKADKMAFSQEDLDELYDSGVQEIFICAENLHIPLKEREVFYIGVNSPTLVIDSEELVDFEALGIAIEGCYFDEEYSKIILATQQMENDEFSKTETEYSEEDTMDDDVANDEDEDDEFDEFEAGELADFCESMKEYFDDFREELAGIEYEDDFDEYFDIDLLDSDDYNSGEYDYDTKAKAKTACKSELTDMVDEVEADLVSAAQSFMLHSKDYYSDLKDAFEEFISDLSDAFDSCADSECGEDMQEYVMSQKEEFFALAEVDKDYEGVSEEDIEKIISKAMKERLSVRDLLAECAFDEDDDYYCFDLDEACDTINNEVENFTSELQEELPKQLHDSYLGAFLGALGVLEAQFDEMFSR